MLLKDHNKPFLKFTYELPAWFFWSVLLSITWFYMVRRVISWDLWWHMASGRFFLENGCFPPLGTFTFSPNSSSTATSQVWFGDIILYSIYSMGGFLGLQAFRTLMILCPIFLIFNISKVKYSIWTLLFSIMMVVGTMQKHLIKNAIYAMLFVSLMVWFWIQIKQFNRKYFIWFYPPMFYLWSIMHGSLKVGGGILILIIVGELIDMILKKKKDFLFAFFLFVSSSLSLWIIDQSWSLGDVKSIIGIFKQEITSEKGARGQSPTSNKAVKSEADMKKEIKGWFRFIFKGTDAKMVAEYQWPFEITYVLSVKILFLLFVVYSAYFIFRLCWDWRSIVWSLELPAIGLLYIGLGYLRTVSYPFLVAIPVMVYGIYYGIGSITEEKFKKVGIRMLLFITAMFILWYITDLFPLFIKLFYQGMDYTKYVGISFLVLFFIAAISLIFFKKKQLEKFSLAVAAIFIIWVLGCLMTFMGYKNYMFYDDKFQKVTGFLDTEQGLGKSNKFFKGVAEYVVKHYPNENIYNTYNMGGYLIWEWYGKRKVFIDGRSAIYDPDFYHDYTHNNAINWIKKNNFKRAIMNLLVDRDRVIFFLQNGWYPIVFDSCMVLMERPMKIDSSFGKLPRFIEGERHLSRLYDLDKKALGMFLDASIYHMMIYGRVKDAKEFIERNPHVFQEVQEVFQKQAKERMAFIRQLETNFGLVNHPQLGVLCKKIFAKTKGFDYHVVMGDTFLALQKYDKAEIEYLQAYKLNNKNVELLKKLADVLLRQNKYDRSIAAFQEAIKLNPKDASLYNNVSLPLTKMKAYDQALWCCQKAVELKPDHFQSYFNAAMVLVEIKKYQDAIKNLKHVLKLNPRFIQAQVQINRINKIIESQK